MPPARKGISTDDTTVPPSKGLRIWLILLTIAAAITFILVLLFGWAINLDTMYDVTARVDPLLRQDAVEKRIFFWTGITLFSALLAAGIIGGWSAFRTRRHRLALRLSLLAAVPLGLCSAAFTLAVMLGSGY